MFQQVLVFRSFQEQRKLRTSAFRGDFRRGPENPFAFVAGWQQPFGGSRASGTNEKAGSILNLMRWVSPRAIKETLVPPRDWRYPFLGES